MYVVRDTNGDVAVIASRIEDAYAYVDAAQLDKTEYTIEEVEND